VLPDLGDVPLVDLDVGSRAGGAVPGFSAGLGAAIGPSLALRPGLSLAIVAGARLPLGTIAGLPVGTAAGLVVGRRASFASASVVVAGPRLPVLPRPGIIIAGPGLPVLASLRVVARRRLLPALGRCPSLSARVCLTACVCAGAAAACRRGLPGGFAGAAGTAAGARRRRLHLGGCLTARLATTAGLRTGLCRRRCNGNCRRKAHRCRGKQGCPELPHRNFSFKAGKCGCPEGRAADA